MLDLFDHLDLRSAEAVVSILNSGSAANRAARCRAGSIDTVRAAPNTRLVLTGDLHDNPLHLARVVRAAALEGQSPAHLTLHELIHGERQGNGMDFSYRVLTRVAALKAAHPEYVHTLLANHELAQALGTTIAKDGVRVVEAFNEAVDYVFGAQASNVREAVTDFVRSMPIALRVRRDDGADILCAHSLPAPELMDRFDPTIIERDLDDADYMPRQGAAHLMIWGRGHTPAQLSQLAERWSIGLFVLGHEHAEDGIYAVEPNTVVLNSDHARGAYLDLDARADLRLDSVLTRARSLAER